jgi:hypothetical protein
LWRRLGWAVEPRKGEEEEEEEEDIPHSILSRWKNYFFQLLNAHGVNDVRQTKMPTAEPLVAEPISFEVEIAI